jgi:uncharacterized protein YkwD
MSVPIAATVRRPRRLALAVALLFGLTSVATFAAPARTFAWDAESFSASSEADLVALTNRSRASAGLSALKVDSVLTSVARWRSKDMIERDYFSHTIPGYGKVWDKLHAVGYCYKLAGENIGWNSYPDDIATAGIHGMFMDSSGHRANILGSRWDRVGIGAYKGPTGKKMWTVLFADKCGTPTATPKPTAKPTAKATAKPTAKPTARPTPKPVRAATPRPTPKIVEAPSPEPTPLSFEDDQLPPTDDPGAASEPTDDPGADPTDDPGAPSEPPADIDPDDTAVGMRVADPGTGDGLLGTIVGGVTGFFFGG